MNRAGFAVAGSCLVALGLSAALPSVAGAIESPLPVATSDCAHVAGGSAARSCPAAGQGMRADGTSPTGSMPDGPGPRAELIPLTLPTGSTEVAGPSPWASGGGTTEMWMTPFTGPDAMTSDQVVSYLRDALPVGRPYRQAGLDLDWCPTQGSRLSWQSAGGGPRDRLEVAVLTSSYVQITMGGPAAPCTPGQP